MGTASELRKQIETALAGRIPAALSPRPLRSPELLSCGVAEVDALLGGGLPLGSIAELTGSRSSGRTTLALSTLAAATRQGHCCAYVDACDSLDPLSAAALGVDLRRLLWVRPPASKSGSKNGSGSRVPHICLPLADMGPTPGKAKAGSPQAAGTPPVPPLSRRGWDDNPYRRLDAALRATDLLLNTGGFRALVLDLGDLTPEQARRVPMATWYRFRLQAEKSCTLLLLIAGAAENSSAHRPSSRTEGAPLPSFGRCGTAERAPTCAQSCAAVCLDCHPAAPDWQRAVPQSPPLLAGLHYRLSLERSRAADSIRKKPVTAACANTPAACGAGEAGFEAAWHGTALWTG